MAGALRLRAAGPTLIGVIALVGLGASPATAPGATSVGGGDAVRLGIPGATNSGVSVAAAGSQVVATWAATRGSSTDIYASFSSDGGASFAPPIRVNDVEGDARVTGEQAPRVRLGQGVEIVWLSKRGGTSLVRAAATPVGQHAFGSAKTVHPENLSGARGWQSLSLDRDGAMHVAWLDGRDAHAAEAAGARSSMRQDLFQAVWRPDGTHDEVRVASDVCFCCKTSVASGIDGTTYVAWRHIYPTNLRDIAVARSTDGGKTFNAPVRVSADGWQIAGCPDDGPSIAVDAAGTLHVAWPTMVEGQEPGKGIFYSYSSDGARTFSPRLRVDDGNGAASHPQLAADATGVAIVWDGGSPSRVYLRDITSQAKTWTPRLGAVLTLGEPVRPANYPAVAASATSTVVAWTETTDAGSEIRVRRISKN